ncbi:MAG: ABC transporter ATP-binding protein, partial [Betaproteobacteria bacterium]|nr:ABC transporter ATP-binding protein [Betaproteobacteria bacterium]
MSGAIVASLQAVERIYPGIGKQQAVHALGPIDLALRQG